MSGNFTVFSELIKCALAHIPNSNLIQNQGSPELGQNIIIKHLWTMLTGGKITHKLFYTDPTTGKKINYFNMNIFLDRAKKVELHEEEISESEAEKYREIYDLSSRLLTRIMDISDIDDYFSIMLLSGLIRENPRSQEELITFLRKNEAKIRLEIEKIRFVIVSLHSVVGTNLTGIVLAKMNQFTYGKIVDYGNRFVCPPKEEYGPIVATKEEHEPILVTNEVKSEPILVTLADNQSVPVCCPIIEKSEPEGIESKPEKRD